MKLPIILALDTKDVAQAASWIKASKESMSVNLSYFLISSYMTFQIL